MYRKFLVKFIAYVDGREVRGTSYTYATSEKRAGSNVRSKRFGETFPGYLFNFKAYDGTSSSPDPTPDKVSEDYSYEEEEVYVDEHHNVIKKD